MPVDGLLADAQHGTLAPPPATLIASEPKTATLAEEKPASPSAAPDPIKSSPAQAIQAELVVQHGGATSLAALDSREGGSASGSVSQNDRVSAADGNGTVGPIKAHLDRIKERYSANEEFADHAPPQVATRSSQSVALSAAAPREVSESSLVVHDNEMVSIKLGDLISLFEDRFDRPLFVWMTSSNAASKFVSLKTLAAAGIKAKFDPATRQLTFSLDNGSEGRPKL